MRIGLILPSLIATKRFEDRIFAPKELFISLADGLVRRGHTVFAYTSPDVRTRAIRLGGDARLEKIDFPTVRSHADNSDLFKVTAYRLTYKEYEILITSQAFEHAIKNKVDILHSYHDFDAHYFSKVVPNIPIVYTLHDPPFAETLIETWKLSHFARDNYIAISKHQASLYKNLNIVDTIYHGIDATSYPFSDRPDGYFAFLGRFIGVKGADKAIKACLSLKVPLHIATSENYLKSRYYREKIKPFISDPLITARGFLRDEKRNLFLSKAAALLFPIHWNEPFGMVMIEAMACGTPVIGFGEGSVPEIVKDGETGYIVSSRKKDAPWIIKKSGLEGIKEAIMRIERMNPSEYRKMRYACRKHIEKNFNLETMLNRHEDIYKKIISERQ